MLYLDFCKLNKQLHSVFIDLLKHWKCGHFFCLHPHCFVKLWFDSINLGACLIYVGKSRRGELRCWDELLWGQVKWRCLPCSLRTLPSFFASFKQVNWQTNQLELWNMKFHGHLCLPEACYGVWVKLLMLFFFLHVKTTTMNGKFYRVSAMLYLE